MAEPWDPAGWNAVQWAWYSLGALYLLGFAILIPMFRRAQKAVARGAVVHLANNLAKGGLLGRHAHWPTVLRFGVPATVAAFAGAALLVALDERAVRVVVGALITGFALFDLLPALRRWQVGPRHLAGGGLLSGFFGGLSGHQGALRSVFLTKLGLDARAFVATGVLCAILVDVARLGVYATRYQEAASVGWPLLGGAVLVAFAGAFLGARLLKGATLEGIRWLVGGLLLALGPLIALGVV